MPCVQSGGTQAGEPVEDRCPYLQLSHLPLEVPSHHAFAQSLEASHLGLYKAAAVIAAPFLPDGAA